MNLWPSKKFIEDLAASAIRGALSGITVLDDSILREGFIKNIEERLSFFSIENFAQIFHARMAIKDTNTAHFAETYCKLAATISGIAGIRECNKVCVTGSLTG